RPPRRARHGGERPGARDQEPARRHQGCRAAAARRGQRSRAGALHGHHHPRGGAPRRAGRAAARALDRAPSPPRGGQHPPRAERRRRAAAPVAGLGGGRAAHRLRPEPAPGAGRPCAADAGLLEPDEERPRGARRDGRAPALDPPRGPLPHPPPLGTRALPLRAGRGHRAGHPRGAPGTALLALLLDQGARHGPGPRPLPAHRRRARRDDRLRAARGGRGPLSRGPSREPGRLTPDLERLRGELEQRHDLVIGRPPAMQEVYKLIGRVAPTDATVLIQGETGTGKELIAKAIHYHSSRGGPFMALNCSAIPNELLESELFGYERGAFTGAVERRIGKFEAAAGGTLFLDEIADMPLALQAKLLRVLQERELTRVGGRDAIRAAVRIIAATNQDLEAAMRAGRFREDLFFRLNVVRIAVPPLRERRADVPELIEFFLDKVNRELGTALVGVSAEARDLLLRHSWPGNVRELENALLRAAVLAGGRTLVPEDFALAGQPRQAAGDALPLEEAVRRRLAELLAADATALPSDLHALLISAVERPLIEVLLQ